MLNIASDIPIQFFILNCSLKKRMPTTVDKATTETLFKVNIPELSKRSLRKDMTRK